jgi:hypothetical protein
VLDWRLDHTSSASPAEFPTATRQATRRRGHPHRATLAAIARDGTPQRDRRPLPAGAGRKVAQPHPSRLRRHPACIVGGRRSAGTGRPPRGSALVAHSRSTTPTIREPGPSDNQHRPSDAAHAHEVRGAAATWAALGAASRLRPEPLTLAARPINTAEVGLGGLSPNPKIPIKRRGARSAPRVVLQRGPLRVGTRRDALRDPASGTSRSIRAGLTRHLTTPMLRCIKMYVRLARARGGSPVASARLLEMSGHRCLSRTAVQRPYSDVGEADAPADTAATTVTDPRRTDQWRPDSA